MTSATSGASMTLSKPRYVCDKGVSEAGSVGVSLLSSLTVSCHCYWVTSSSWRLYSLINQSVSGFCDKYRAKAHLKAYEEMHLSCHYYKPVGVHFRNRCFDGFGGSAWYWCEKSYKQQIYEVIFIIKSHINTIIYFDVSRQEKTWGSLFRRRRMLLLAFRFIKKKIMNSGCVHQCSTSVNSACSLQKGKLMSLVHF